MTKDLANLDQCIEAKAFLTNPLNEYQKMINQGLNIPEVTNEFQRLSRIINALDQRIALLKTTK